MAHIAHIPPLQRQALLAAQSSPTHTLVRTRGGFIPQGAPTAHAMEFTVRVVRMMYRDFLLSLDDDEFPHAAKLTSKGAAIAQLLQAQAARKAKAGAA